MQGLGSITDQQQFNLWIVGLAAILTLGLVACFLIARNGGAREPDGRRTIVLVAAATMTALLAVMNQSTMVAAFGVLGAVAGFAMGRASRTNDRSQSGGD